LILVLGINAMRLVDRGRYDYYKRSSCVQISREEILLPMIADKAIVIEVLVARRRRLSVCVAMFTMLLKGPLTWSSQQSRSRFFERLSRIYEVSVELRTLVCCMCRHVEDEDGCLMLMML
jgi:hypothetical protein